jgi:hypothetical protein
MPVPAVSQLPVADVQLVTRVAALGAIAGLFAYLFVVHRLKLVPLLLLGVLAAVFVGQQTVYAAVVEPTLVAEAESAVEPAAARLAPVYRQAQTSFEIGFVAKLVLVIVQLSVEDLLGGEGALRELRDVGVDTVAAVLVLAAGVGLVLVDAGAHTATLVPVCSLLFSLKLVEAFVDLSIALAAD